MSRHDPVTAEDLIKFHGGPPLQSGPPKWMDLSPFLSTDFPQRQHLSEAAKVTRPDGKSEPKQTDSKSGPRPMRAAVASIAAYLLDVISIGGRVPLPHEAERLARRWVYGEGDDDDR